MKTLVITDFSEKYVELDEFLKELEHYATHNLVACFKANMNSILFESKANFASCRKVAERALEILQSKADPEVVLMNVDFYLAIY